MTSYFEIYDDQENDAPASGPVKVASRKQIKSVLSEISQNAKNPFKRITKSDDCEAFSGKEHPAHPHKATTKRKREANFSSQNKENSFSANPIIKKSSPSIETLDTVAPLLAISDSEDDQSSCSVVSVTDESDDSSVFQDTSIIQDILSKQTSRDDILSISPSEKHTSGDDLLSVSHSEKHFSGDDLLSVSHSEKHFSGDDLLSVSPSEKHTSGNDLLSVSPSEKHFSGNDILSVSPSEKHFSEDDILSVSPSEKHTSRDDMLSVSEYSDEIHSYLKGRERRVMTAWNYMDRQRHITHDMRAILVNWLVEVAVEYKLETQTVYLAMSYVDRFLSLMMVERSKLQLIGTAAMFLAAKYEEIYPPPVEEFAYITDNTYTKNQVLRMENLILKVLGFNVSVPTSLEFLHHYSQMFMLDNTTLNLAQYLNELSLLDGKTFLQFSPSMLAASSLVLARHTLGVEAWPDDMAARVGYNLGHLKECVVGLYESFVASPNLVQQAIRIKFKDSRFGQVADISPVNIF